MSESLWLCVFLLALLLAINVWLVARVLTPLRRLARQAERLAHGDFAALECRCGGITEVDALRRSMVAMVGHVRRAQELGQRYADALTNGQEAERARIARELHDDTVQSLIGVVQGIDLASAWLDQHPAQAVEMLKSTRLHTVETVNNLRTLIGDLRPPALEELGLVSALRMLASKPNSLPLEVRVHGVERRLSEAYELALFRSAQEALANAQRHSRATQAALTVTYMPERVRLEIVDNGAGFAVPESLDHLAARGHFGLVGIQERVHSLGGEVRIDSKTGAGTRVVVDLLVGASAQPADEVRDPVCSALLKPQQAYGSVAYAGQVYYFCCPVCQGEFQRSPSVYLNGRA